VSAVEIAFSLGSNLGDKAETLRRAVAVLEAAGIARDLVCSPFYATPPWGPVAQDSFVNACAVGVTALDAFAVLRRIKAAEVALGRVEGVRWGPRAIDIDILYRGEDAILSPDLTLPHRHMLERAFVLVPLAHLRPGKVIRGVTVSDAAARADASGVVRLPG
jgi:2-amino-4-hydroxy-6-hydroxymethyldihydropteridine diphosphokinase